MVARVLAPENSLSAPLYERALGRAWRGLAPGLRQFFSRGKLRAEGAFDVRWGPGTIARWVAKLLRLPPPGMAVPVTLDVSPHDHGERWTRRFGSSVLVTEQRTFGSGRVAERFGLAELVFALVIDEGELEFRHICSSLVLGPLRIPFAGMNVAARVWTVPGKSNRSVDASEDHRAGPGCIRIRVTASAVLIGDLLTYEGFVGPKEERP
jgi:hypothetical protein